MISTSGECLYFDKNNNVWITLSLFQYLLIRTCEHMEDKKKKKIYRLFKSLIVSWTWIHLSKEGVSPTPTSDIPVQKRFDCLISRWGFSGRGSLSDFECIPRERISQPILELLVSRHKQLLFGHVVAERANNRRGVLATFARLLPTANGAFTSFVSYFCYFPHFCGCFSLLELHDR
jgi:hypothetical protein